MVYLITKDTFKDYEDLSVNVDVKRIKPCIRKAMELDLKPFMGHAFFYDFIKWFSNSGWQTAAITEPATSAANGTYSNKDIVSASGSGGKATFVVNGGKVTQVTQTAAGKNYSIGLEFTCQDIPGASLNISTLSDELIVADNIPDNYRDLFTGAEYDDPNGHTIIYEGMIPTVVYFTFARFIEVDAIRYTSTGPVQKHHDQGDPVSAKMIAQMVSNQRSIANAHANEIEKYLWDNRNDFPLWRYNEKNKNARQPGPRIRGVDKTQFNRMGYGTNNSNYWPNDGNYFGY